MLTRAERLKVLQEDGRWKDEQSVFGLPKVRTYVPKKLGKKKKEKVPAEGAEGVPAVEGAAAAPAPGAAKGAAKGSAKPAGAAPGAAKPAAGKSASKGAEKAGGPSKKSS